MRSMAVVRKKRVGPATGLDPGTAIRLSDSLRKAVDEWRRRQSDLPSRSEAIRRLVEQALKNDQPLRAGPHKGAAKATAMAGKELDLLGQVSHQGRASAQKTSDP